MTRLLIKPLFLTTVTLALLPYAHCEDPERINLFNKIRQEANAFENTKPTVSDISIVAQKNAVSVGDYVDTVNLLGQLLNKSEDPDRLREAFVAEHVSNDLSDDPGWQINAMTSIAQTPDIDALIGNTHVAPEALDVFEIMDDSQNEIGTAILIAPRVLLTAGHCLSDGNVKFADNHVTPADHSGNGERRMIIRKLLAKGYKLQQNPPFIRNDLALLFLDKAVSTANPRPLAALNDIEKAPVVELVGYGATNPAGTEHLGTRREAPQVPLSPILNPNWPANAEKYGCDASSEFVCGPNKTRTDSCNGDSGGPALISKNGKDFIAGVVSRGIVCKNPDGTIVDCPCGKGGIYARVDQYEKWISEAIGDSSNFQ